MSKFRLLSASALSALASGSSAPADDADSGPEPGKGGTDQGGAAAPAGGGDAGADKTGKPADQGGEPGQSGAADAATDVVAAADAAAAIRTAEAKGFAAANARMSTVFASDEAKADPSLAAFLLTKSDASAEDIVAQMKDRAPAPAAGGAAAPGAVIPDTKLDLGRGKDPKALAGDGSKSDDEDDGWGAAQANTAGAYGARAPAGAVAAAASATAAGARLVSTPAIPPTGN